MPDLIPVSELPIDRETTIELEDMPHPRLIWGVDLPTSLDQDRLLLDVGHLRRLQTLSSNVLTLVTTNPEASSAEYDTSIQGITFGGAAVGGRSRKVKDADPSVNQIQYEFTSRADRKNYGRYIDTHLLNKPAMIDQVTEKKRKNLTNEEAWAEVLDRHIQTSMRQAAREVLLTRKGIPRAQKYLEYLWTFSLSGFVIAKVIEGDTAEAAEVASALAFGLAINQGLSFDSRSTDTRLLDIRDRVQLRRWSILTESQPDRYLAFDALTRVNSLIKVKK